MKKLLNLAWLMPMTTILSVTPVWGAEKTIKISPAAPFAETLTKLTISSILSGIITLIFVVAALIFFFMLIIGGLQWMTSGGDKAATETARGRITAALIGLVIVFGGWAIGKIIETVFGINIFSQLTIPSFIPS